MRLVLLRNRNSILGKNNGRRDFGEVWKHKEIEYCTKEIINR